MLAWNDSSVRATVELERLRADLARANAEVAALKAGREVPTSITRCMVRLGGVWITPDAARDEIHRLRAEIDALKAANASLAGDAVGLRIACATLKAERDALAVRCDPLAEMWAALADYQPMAERDGHGESWARMCRDRTQEAAYAAAWARAASPTASEWSWASRAAEAAARAESEAAIWAQRASAAIRKAKEAKP
jgi:hypothetical protein